MHIQNPVFHLLTQVGDEVSDGLILQKARWLWVCYKGLM